MARKAENNGWICLHRSIQDWQWYDNLIVKAVFIDLLLSANSSPAWFKGRRLYRGQTAVSVETLCLNNGISKPTCLKALKALEGSGEIVREKYKFYTITTICNYNHYQAIKAKEGKASLPSALPTLLPSALPEQQYNNDNNIVEGNNNAHTHEDKNILTDILASPSLLESFAKNERLTAEQVTQLAEEVYIEWQLAGEDTKPTSLNKSRFLSHIRAKGQAKRTSGMLQVKPVAERKAEFLAECKALVEKGCSREKVAEFARYYTQPTADGRLLFETYKGWNTETRFLLNQKKQKQ